MTHIVSRIHPFENEVELFEKKSEAYKCFKKWSSERSEDEVVVLGTITENTSKGC